MTNNIEELMKTANVKKQVMCKWTCKGTDLCNASCEHFEIKRDLIDYYDYECDYGKGYLDCLWEICKRCSIPVERTEMSLHILTEEQSSNFFGATKLPEEVLA